MDNTDMNSVKESGENTSSTRRNVINEKKQVNFGLIISAIVLTLIVIAIVAFAVVNKLNHNVYNNVYLAGVDLSGKTQEEVIKVIDELNNEFRTKSITIMHEDSALLEMTPTLIDMKIDVKKTLATVMNFGRDSLISGNFNIFKALFKPYVVEPIYEYSDAKLTGIALELTSGIEGRVKDDSFKVDAQEYNLVITRGTSGKDIVMAEFKEDITSALIEGNKDVYVVELENRKPTEIDVDIVYSKVNKEAKDAYIEEKGDKVEFVNHEVGITFDKEKLREELAKEENAAEGKVITFKLTIEQPKVKIQDITKDMYREVLGTYESSYADSDANRASNVALGAKMLNGTIVMPGETFSFNKVMGDCGLSSRGFKTAAVFKGGKVVQEVGGGICQISSTLYVATLYANLGIVTRYNHALPVGYVPVSLDATVYYPSTDFKFKNTRNYPVKIVATTTASRKLRISIMGTKEDKEYTIELSSWVTSYIEPKVIEQKTDKLEVGKTKVTQNGTRGFNSVAYKTVKYNGKVISKELLSTDSYSYTPKIIQVGTKVVTNPGTENPTPGGEQGGETNPGSGSDTPSEPQQPGDGETNP